MRSHASDSRGPFTFFYHDTPTTEIYTLSLTTLFRSSLPTHATKPSRRRRAGNCTYNAATTVYSPNRDRKSTRLNSSHTVISYAVFCLKKKKRNAGVRPSGQGAARRPIHERAVCVRRM